MTFFKRREREPAPPFLHAYDDDFDTLINDGPGVAIVDFWAPWCAPCR